MSVGGAHSMHTNDMLVKRRSTAMNGARTRIRPTALLRHWVVQLVEFDDALEIVCPRRHTGPNVARDTEEMHRALQLARALVAVRESGVIVAVWLGSKLLSVESIWSTSNPLTSSRFESVCLWH